MKAFFEKYPVELKESIAIKMIHKVIESAEEKCKENDPAYMTELAKAYEMLEMYFGEKGVNPASLT